MIPRISPKISVIIPTYNERGNVDALIERLCTALKHASIVSYEYIFVDDHSNDGTYEHLNTLAVRNKNVKVFLKKGKKGKSWSILEGIEYTQYDNIAMIDADLQYPPEVIPKMLEQLGEADIVVANRTTHHTGKKRSWLSKIFNLLFGKILFGMNVDMQSGLKVFKKDVFYNLSLHPTEWGFDYEFLYKTQRMRWKICSVDIDFADRISGKSKVNVIKTGLELVTGALGLRIRYALRSLLKFTDHPHHSEARPINFKNTKDFLFIPEIHSAKKTLYRETISLAIVFSLAFFALLYLFGSVFSSALLVILSGSIALFYFTFMIFKIWVVYQATQNDPTINISKEDIANFDDDKLPIYTILIPLYREEKVINQVIKAMTAIDYPPEKLDIIITLEEYDHQTINAIAEAHPPAHFKTLILPDVQPKTKPKALNVAFLQVRGEFLVIYDAEIIPDHDQLKKAVIAFRKHDELACLQTRLDHYNPRQSLVTRFFNSEFSFHYDYFLPGLQELGFPLPLSGHSTHYRTSVLKDIGAWDPYNVTEDCDIGMRLHRAGQRAGMINSSSQEEATISFKAWILQRTRWMKGFIQTSIVHLRHPFRFKREIGGWIPFLGFFFIVPGGVLVNILNFVSWIILLVWLVAHPPFIQTLYPLPVLYVATFSFIVGNFVFTYMNLLAIYKRKRYDIVKYNLLSFVYWIMLAIATVRATIEFVIKPHYWEKTVHGTHLARKRHFRFFVPLIFRRQPVTEETSLS